MKRYAIQVEYARGQLRHTATHLILLDVDLKAKVNPECVVKAFHNSKFALEARSTSAQGGFVVSPTRLQELSQQDYLDLSTFFNYNVIELSLEKPIDSYKIPDYKVEC